MEAKLKPYFPMLQSREDLMRQIEENTALHDLFRSWSAENRNQFLDFCTGVRGIRLLRDGFFKEIFNPEYTPERLNRFLSLLLKQEVSVLQILQNDSTRLADESALLITDVVVELQDRSIANVEVQRIGYAFPGERCACYSADLLLRQYKRLRGEKGKCFSYRDIKTVYTIVLFEKSPLEFRKFSNTYLHFAEQKFDTGLRLNLLQKYLLIPLDMFGKIIHNRTIENELEAWLAFLSQDDPEIIIELITEYPLFKPMYEQIYGMCRNVGDVMGIFSEELAILDRNTVQYMIDELQEQIEASRAELENAQEQIEASRAELENAQEQTKNAEAQLNRVELEKQKAEKEVQKAQKEKVKAQKDAQRAQEDAQRAQEENQTLAEEIKKLQEQLEQLKKQ